MRAEPIVIETWFAAKPEVVWRAITDPVLMRQWYFEAVEDFRPEVGFETAFDVESGDRVFRHQWKVTDAVPGERITYTWEFEGIAGIGATEWRLTPTDGGTRLTLVNTGLETFPSEIPEFSPESCRAGWEYFIEGNLSRYLEQG